MLYKTGFVSISPTVAEWQATQNCVKDRHKIFPTDCYSPHPQWRMGTIFPPTAIAPILNGGWGQ